MCWKKLPYWTRGGIILSGIYLVISLICLIEAQIGYGTSDMGTVGYWVIMGLGICLLFIYEKLFLFVNKLVYNAAQPHNQELLPLIIFIILNSVIYFIIGSIIGWIIGRIKNKNRAR